MTGDADRSLSPSPPHLQQAIPGAQGSWDEPGEDIISHNRGPVTGSSVDEEDIPYSASTTISATSGTQPISIPLIPNSLQDPNRFTTPLSGRGDRQGHYFPFHRTPSPRDRQSLHDQLDYITNLSLEERRHGNSPASRLRHPHILFSTHTEHMAASRYTSTSPRYTPTSPLSPRLPATARPLSPQPAPRGRAMHSRKDSRGQSMNLPRYHPANFQHCDTPPSGGSFQNPSITLRAPPPTTVETPRVMRERQRELIDRAKMASKIAASSRGVKPNAPRLDPLGSPKGAMTPFALEDGAADYFTISTRAPSSPGASPGDRSDDSVNELGDELRRKKPSKT